MAEQTEHLVQLSAPVVSPAVPHHQLHRGRFLNQFLRLLRVLLRNRHRNVIFESVKEAHYQSHRA